MSTNHDSAGSNDPIAKMPDLRLTRLRVENFMRVELAEMYFKDSLVTIGGENGHGKSSCLNALEALLKGLDRKATKIVHDGAEAYLIEAEFGNSVRSYIVQRTGTTKGNGPIKVVNADDNSEIKTPAAFLGALLSDIGIDPFGDFILQQPKDQRAVLAGIVHLDTSDLDSEIEETRLREKALDTQFTMLVGKVDGMTFHEDAPKERPSIGELAEELNAANQINSAIDRAEQDAQRALAEVSDIEAQVADLGARIEALNAKKEQILTGAVLAEVKNRVGTKKVDTDAIKAKIDGIEDSQKKYDDNQVITKARQEVGEKEKERVACVNAIKSLNEQKKQRLAEAVFPCPGLAFDESQVLYNGKPFHQASDAEKIRVAMQIALAKKGRLAPIIIRQGSMLDDKTLKLVGEIAAENGAQVFVETVANKRPDGTWDKECSFLLEEGRLVK